MKKPILVIALLLACIPEFAQNHNAPKVGLFEFEIGADMLLGNKCGYHSIEPGMGFNLEGRFNLNSSPFDIGIQFAIGQFSRSDGVHSYGVRYVPSMICSCDYNFRISKAFTPFAGLGIGLSDSSSDMLMNDEIFGKEYIGKISGTSLIVYPRVGIEFIEHIRLNIGYKCYFDRYHNAFLIGVGFVIGGGSVKQ